jgi:Fe-S-cluster-containing hydrogenase component 2
MIEINENACPQNHPCPAVRLCPVEAIVQDDIRSAPHIDDDLCTDCGACTQVCRVFSQVPDAVAVG